MTALTYLDLSANQFAGVLPPLLGRLLLLSYLDISSNMITGRLPCIPSYYTIVTLTGYKL